MTGRLRNRWGGFKKDLWKSLVATGLCLFSLQTPRLVRYYRNDMKFDWICDERSKTNVERQHFGFHLIISPNIFVETTMEWIFIRRKAIWHCLNITRMYWTPLIKARRKIWMSMNSPHTADFGMKKFFACLRLKRVHQVVSVYKGLMRCGRFICST